MRSLYLEGSLAVNLDGRDITVTADGSVVRAEIRDVRMTVPALTRWAATFAFARRLSRVLAARGMRLVVTRYDTPIAELGAGVRNGPLWRLLGLSHIRIPKFNRL